MLTLVACALLVTGVLLPGVRRGVAAVWLAPYALGVCALGAFGDWARPVLLGLQASGVALALAFAWLNRSAVRRSDVPRPVTPPVPERRPTDRRPAGRQGRPSRLRLPGQRSAPLPASDRTVIVPDQYLPRGRDVPTPGPGSSAG
jgi:hypothetical protein